MLYLGIETSCDETALALLRYQNGRPELIAEVISSQIELHARYGGVVPELASREHLSNLPPLLNQLLESVSLSLTNVDRLVVTAGPGLKGCLLMGLSFGKGLATACRIPMSVANHIEGHLFAPFLESDPPEYPFLALVVSGGHTEIIQVNGLGEYEIVARTIDDAAGEAFDKSANLLGLPYPGGAELSKIADSVRQTPYTLPRVMREAEGLSFSGLKTAIALLVKKAKSEGELSQQSVAELAFAVQESIVDALCFKVRKAIEKTGIKKLVLTGGVSANRRLRQELQSLEGVALLAPDFKHCMDNAAMIALVGAMREEAGIALRPDSAVFARWPLESIQDGFR